jgi:hypothetical protein
MDGWPHRDCFEMASRIWCRGKEEAAREESFGQARELREAKAVDGV